MFSNINSSYSNQDSLLFTPKGPYEMENSDLSIPSTKEKLRVMLEHTKLFEELLGQHKNFALMKKHYKAYVNGFDGAKELRVKLMEAENSKEIESIIAEFLN